MKTVKNEYSLYALDPSHDLVECIKWEWVDAVTLEPTGKTEVFLKGADGKIGERVKEHRDGTLETETGICLSPQLYGDWVECEGSDQSA